MLRKAIKEHNLKETIEENNQLMTANFRDPKLFLKLVNKKRMNNQGYTSMIKVDEVEYRGDNQVLAGFFEYHNNNSNPPPVCKSDNSHTYYYATINVSAIAYIVKQRNWKLPQLSIDQVEGLIARLKNNKSPDFSGFSTTHVKKGGRAAAYFLMRYLNLSFQCIQYGVPEEELTGIASLVFKGGKKSLTNPKSFRKITVCALLGQMKQMAVCDIALPIIRPLKPSSQLGFTPGLFVKLANIMVTEKRAYAVFHDKIVLHQFLDASDAFGQTLHPIIMSQMFDGRLEDDS